MDTLYSHQPPRHDAKYLSYFTNEGFYLAFQSVLGPESRYRYSRIRELFVPLLSVFPIGPSITGCPGCSITEEREATRWPLRLLLVSRRVPIRWLSRNGRLFVRPEDGWLSNNRTDTSLLVTKLDAFVFPRGAHIGYTPVCDPRYMTMDLVSPRQRLARFARWHRSTHTYTRAHVSHLWSEDHVLNLTLSVRIFSERYECTIYKKCDDLRRKIIRLFIECRLLKQKYWYKRCEIFL